ncbi:MAG: septum formation initiator family protein [Bacteroidales bacterium]|nr:septum formation initiator family protein [Bacteroidales bacterium]
MALRNKKDGLLTRKDHNYFVPFVIIVTALVALWLLFLSHSSVLNWARAGLEVRTQERRMERYRQEIQEMDAEIDALTHNRDSLEKFAREQYRFAVPGDDVYLMP